jgi:hypothetical protein
MTDLSEPPKDRIAGRRLGIRVVAGAIVLSILAVAYTLSWPGSLPLLLREQLIPISLPVSIFALSAWALRLVVESRFGKPPLAGPWWLVTRLRIFFIFAVMIAFFAMAVVCAMFWIAGIDWAFGLWRALVALLTGASIVLIISISVSELLRLLSPLRL